MNVLEGTTNVGNHHITPTQLCGRMSLPRTGGAGRQTGSGSSASAACQYLGGVPSKWLSASVAPGASGRLDRSSAVYIPVKNAPQGIRDLAMRPYRAAT